MKTEDVKNYIRQLLNTIEVDKEEAEIPNAVLLLIVYIAGLQKKPFPLDFVGKEEALDIEKELPSEFHTLVAQLSIKKSKIVERTGDIRVIEYLNSQMLKLLEMLKKYFITS